MRAEQFAANVAASLVAHMGLFFAASRFMINTTGVPDLDILINATEITEKSLTVAWVLRVNDNSVIKTVRASILSHKNVAEELNMASPFISNNSTLNSYRFSNLQANASYNVCLTISCDGKVDLTKCKILKTAKSDYYRLTLLSSKDSTKSIEFDLTFTRITLAFAALILIGISVYSLYTKHHVIVKRHFEHQEHPFNIIAGENKENDEFSNDVMQPLLLVEDTRKHKSTANDKK